LTYNANALHEIVSQSREPAMAKTAEILEIPATVTARGHRACRDPQDARPWQA
jgi:hypothetical protein